MMQRILLDIHNNNHRSLKLLRAGSAQKTILVSAEYFLTWNVIYILKIWQEILNKAGQTYSGIRQTQSLEAKKKTKFNAK